MFLSPMRLLRTAVNLSFLLTAAVCAIWAGVCIRLYRSSVMEHLLKRVDGESFKMASVDSWVLKESTLIHAHSTLSEGYASKEKERQFPWKPHKAKDVDCSKLFAGEEREVERSKEVEGKLPPLPTAEDVGKLAKNCIAFLEEYGFIMSSLTEEERNFPIAYSILTYKDAYQVAQLLAAIYRPQNIYCIHADKKVEASYRDALTSMADCFDNVFLTSRSVDVEWGTFTVLEPDLICMQELWRFKKWKYFINLTGQEFPLRTNWELVRILTVYNGANDVEGTVKRAQVERWEKAGPAPHGIVPVKGSVHVALNRDFVDFILHSPVAQDFLDWTRRTDHASETFFSSLNHNPQLRVTGSYKGRPETDPILKPFLTRFKNWGGYPFDYPCAWGNWIRQICILSTGDLPLLDKRPEMFANKFFQDYSRIALDCLQERLYNHTRDVFLGKRDFNTSYYESLSYVKNMVTAEEANWRTVNIMENSSFNS